MRLGGAVNAIKMNLQFEAMLILNMSLSEVT